MDHARAGHGLIAGSISDTTDATTTEHSQRNASERSHTHTSAAKHRAQARQ